VFRISIPLLSLVMCAALATSATAQLPLNDKDTQQISPLFEDHSADSLKCSIEGSRPALDFAFRFIASYEIRCTLGIFEGKKASIINYLRVTPQGKPPVIFGSAYHLPDITPEMLKQAGGNFRKLKNQIGMSGAVSVGEGDYSIELLVTDDQNRACRKRWTVRASRNHAQRDVQIAIPPLTVEALDRAAWEVAAPQTRGGLRLTILLDAAPVNPYQARLYAWDRIFLLECVYSLLQQTPYKSIRLVAFNLEQQREIFRDEQFGSGSLLSLSRALRAIETASVSVQALKKRNSPEFLVNLANKELSADERPDAIVFVGPNSRVDVRMSADLLTAAKPGSSPFFYFEYFPWTSAQFPDSIQRLVKAADGRTFRIHNPAELDQAIQKMLAQLKQE
jgi:hypothetical protein